MLSRHMIVNDVTQDWHDLVRHDWHDSTKCMRMSHQSVLSSASDLLAEFEEGIILLSSDGEGDMQL